MNREEHIAALLKLGRFMQAWLSGSKPECDSLAGSGTYAAFEHAVNIALAENEWFTDEGVRTAIATIASEMLSEPKLSLWLSKYAYVDAGDTAKPVGVIAAGNIPLVCFHDILCVLLSGNRLLLKPSSKDKALVGELLKLLVLFEPRLGNRMELTDRIEPSSICRLIATGSNNTARYLEYEYRGVPTLLRKSRTSVAVLTGHESKQELALLADDVFMYAGMGCRNVSKLYVPEGYRFSDFIEASKAWADGMKHYPKYMHCCNYERAMYVSLNEEFVDGEFFLLKKNSAYISPLAVINFDFFTSLDSLKSQFIQDADMLQCVVTAANSIGTIRFGQAQQPSLSDYADGIDTMGWLNTEHNK